MLKLFKKSECKTHDILINMQKIHKRNMQYPAREYYFCDKCHKFFYTEGESRELIPYTLSKFE